MSQFDIAPNRHFWAEFRNTDDLKIILTPGSDLVSKSLLIDLVGKSSHRTKGLYSSHHKTILGCLWLKLSELFSVS